VELKHVKELMAAMGRTGTKKLTLKKEGFELQLERDGDEAMRYVETLPEHIEEPFSRNMPSRTGAALSKGRELSTSLAAVPTAAEEEAAYVYVTSPMVGTFYLAPTPGDPPFVKVGDKIEKHTVVCIIEAMKVMNEVKAGVAGTIVEILAEDGHPVEFGSKLFRIS
jgi:acetyl-CoA carboxylase biotin carboxyl carrier protein